MGAAAKAVIDIDLEGSKATAGLAQLTGAINGFAGKAKSAMYAVGAAIAVDKIRDAAVAMLGAFNSADKVARKLNTTLDTTGNMTGFTKEQLAGMREELAATSTTSATALAEVQNIFARTKVMGGEIFKEATQTAMDFAASMGTDVKGAAEELAEAMMDPANEIEKFRRFGITFTDQEKAMLAQMQSTGKGMEAQRFVLSKLNGVVGGQAAAAFNSLGGQQEALGNKVEGLQAHFGGLISEALLPLYPLVSNIVDVFMQWMPVIEQVAMGFVNGAQSLLGWITPLSVTQEAIAGWSALVQSIMERWDDYIAVALLGAAANVMAFATDVAYYFTEVIPHYAKVLWTVMKDIFSQIGEIFHTVVANIKKILADVWQAIKDIMSGKMPTFTPVALLEGFELKLSEMPTLAAKQMGATEQALRQAADDLSMELGADVALKTKIKLEEAAEKEAAKEVSVVPVPVDPLTLTAPVPASSGGGTEGILAMADRISNAASAVKLQTAVGAVGTQVAETNKLIAGGLDIKDASINVDVKQTDVVAAIRESTAAIVSASGKPAPQAPLTPPSPAASGGVGVGTEGFLATADRIANAASAVNLQTAVGAVATQITETNKLIAVETSAKDIAINVDVKQTDVVAAIRESTVAIVKASGKAPGGFS